MTRLPKVSITGHPELDGEVSIFSKGGEAAVLEAPLATRVTGSAACRRSTRLGVNYRNFGLDFSCLTFDSAQYSNLKK